MPVIPDDPNMAQAWITGDPPDQTIDFYIPRGNQGVMGPTGPIGPSLAVGSIETNSGPAAAGTLGPTGPKGDKGDPGGFTASTIIGTGISFDTLITSGLYFNPVANSAAAPGPIGTGGHLEVIGAASWIYQRYTPMGEQRGTYIRSRNSSSIWAAWRVVNATRVDQTAGRAIYQWDDINGRDQLIYGDTGQRDIRTAYCNGAASALTVRRVGSLVTLTCVAWIPPANATANVLLSALPVGWRNYNSLAFAVLENGSVLKAGAMGANTSSIALGGNVTSGSYNFHLSYLTADTWPTSLIGDVVTLANVT